ncbi:MAG: hypothetical protein JETT_2898 [Candidatus Jettenia ecosi]|uniref:Uncharacterized protein n=1 Tax=Candidatus Jettenia ecosi TaxID=2494326 RepID=A0A533Q856_9BACT|nr:MAG: hypothetical protein JETT_2898 [Candidatus Jettenia ecosi]
MCLEGTVDEAIDSGYILFLVFFYFSQPLRLLEHHYRCQMSIRHDISPP